MFEHYPFPVPRPHAQETIERIDAAFKAGKKFVLVDAVTGSGKSSLAVTFARATNGIILTPTRFLQLQYQNTPQFDREYTVAGKSNYNCGLKDFPHVSADEALCCSDSVTHNSRELIPYELPENKGGSSKALKLKCVGDGICPYYNTVYNIGKVPGAVPNYDLFFRIKKYPGAKWGMDMGDALCMDEAHQLLAKIRDIFGFKYSILAATRLLGPEGLREEKETPAEWLKRLRKLAAAIFKEEMDTKAVAKLDAFLKRVDYILNQDIENEKMFYVEDKGTEIEIKPLDMRYLKNKIFFPFERVLMLSATFPSNFREMLGISAEESEFITIPSVFPSARRPTIYFRDLPKLNKDTVLTPNLINIKALDHILNLHSSHKGIIHTVNYKLMKQLQEIYRSNPRFIWVNQDDIKQEMFERHVSSPEPTILVSPSFMEGVDLKDDLARFGVLLKLPYPFLDEYSKRMMRIFPSWYESCTATSICQAYGRNVRSENDWAKFYIIDGMFGQFIMRAKKCFSKYFLESIEVTSFEVAQKHSQRSLL